MTPLGSPRLPSRSGAEPPHLGRLRLPRTAVPDPVRRFHPSYSNAKKGTEGELHYLVVFGKNMSVHRLLADTGATRRPAS